MAVLEAALGFCAANFLYIILSLCLCIILYAWGVAPYRRSVLVAAVGDLPGPTPLPFIGQIHDFLRPKYKEKGFLCFNDYYKKYGRLYAMYIFGQPIVMVSDPEMVKEIMVKEFNSFHDRPNVLGFKLPEPFDSMMTASEGATWQRIRNALSPTFSTLKMKLMIPLMNSACDVLMTKMEEVAKTGESFNIHKFNQGLTMDTILKTAFGIHSDVQLNYDDPAFKAARGTFDIGKLRQLVQTVLLLLPTFIRGVVIKAFPGIFVGHFNDIVQMTEQIITVKKQRQQDGKGFQKDMLDLMLDAAAHENKAKQLTKGEVMAQSIVFLLAGYETTNATLSFACHSLATNPEVQEKLQLEIDSAWTDEDQMLSYETVNQLPYLDMVLSETLRMYPPGFMIARVCTNDCIVKGVHFRKGTGIFTDVYSLHHDAEFFPDPEKFDPERFTAEAKQTRDPYVYLPFGHGPHNCIGMRFAQLEIKLALARILKKYSFVVTPETKIPPPIKALNLLGCGNEMDLGIEARR